MLFNIGVNNLFDVYLDKNIIGNLCLGMIVDVSGNIIVLSFGVFIYLCCLVLFGFNGVYYYVGVEYKF